MSTGTAVQLATPVSVEIVPPKPLGVAEAPQQGAADMALAVVAKTPESRQELICRDLLPPAMQAEAEKMAIAIYPQMLADTQVLMNYGVPELQGVNTIVERLLREVEPVRITELHEAMKDLNKTMRNKKAKYDVSDPDVAERYRKMSSGVRKWLNRGKAFVEDMRADLLSMEKQLDRMAADLAGRQSDITRNVALFDVLYQENEAEIGKLIYVIAVMEYVVDEAGKDAEQFTPDPDDIANRNNEERQRRADLISAVKAKIGDFKGRLFIAWATSPQTRMMRSVDVGMANKLNNLVTSTIPTMKGVLLQWQRMAKTMEAADFAAAVDAMHNRVVTEFFEAGAQTLPDIASVIQTPSLTPQTIASVTDSLALAAEGVLEEFVNGEQKRKELNQAIFAAQGKLATVHEKVDSAIIDQVVESASQSEDDLIKVPATPALTA